MCAQEDSAIRGVTAGHTCARAARSPPRCGDAVAEPRALPSGLELRPRQYRSKMPAFPMTKLLLCRTAGAFALLWPAVSVAQTPVDCARNPDQARWFVRAGAPGDGAGTNERPFASLADIERCAPAGATITVLAPAEGAAPLDGGIRLKERQKLVGIAPPPGGKPAARLTNSCRHRRRRHARARQRGRASPHRQPGRRGDFRRQRQRHAPPRSAADTPRDRGTDRPRRVAVPRRQDRRCRGYGPVGPARLQPGAGWRRRQGRRR